MKMKRITQCRNVSQQADEEEEEEEKEQRFLTTFSKEATIRTEKVLKEAKVKSGIWDCQ